MDMESSNFRRGHGDKEIDRSREHLVEFSGFRDTLWIIGAGSLFFSKDLPNVDFLDYENKPSEEGLAACLVNSRLEHRDTTVVAVEQPVPVTQNGLGKKPMELSMRPLAASPLA